MTQIKISQKEINDLADKDILEIIGLGNLDEEKKQKLRGKILETVQNRVFKRIIELLEKKGKISEYENIVDDKSVEDFFRDNGINYEAIFLEEALFYKSQLKAASVITGAVSDKKEKLEGDEWDNK